MEILRRRIPTGFRDNRGFTLVEMAAVTAITGLLATVALPVVARGLAWWQVQTVAWQLVNEIRTLQQVAMSGEDRHRMILLDADHGLYRLKENTTIIKEVTLPPGVTMELNLQYTGSGGGLVYGNELSFTLEGEPVNSGKIILRDRYGRPYYIVIMPFTGRVRAGSTP
ncbi:type II secretion system protein [Moorella sp. Hama-1]|uniref:type II secretion system protein n=1 Tax=Moorella sp. Hama-1 TaxID=2138101 RepID=UPI000D65924B|nr:type II secretion system protein [Moorella sp. Hama-1]BCV21809.1 prepilin-type N-terminal cleavage/methylation domain-containing protein [Moorella sp. Hama-1]